LTRYRTIQGGPTKPDHFKSLQLPYMMTYTCDLYINMFSTLFWVRWMFEIYRN